MSFYGKNNINKAQQLDQKYLSNKINSVSESLSFVDSQCNEMVRKTKSLMNMTDTTKRLLNKVDNKDDNRIM